MKKTYKPMSKKDNVFGFFDFGGDPRTVRPLVAVELLGSLRLFVFAFV